MPVIKRQPDVTRQTLLDAAFAEIHRNGFRAASLDAILSNVGVTKGALYHHFASKNELGYAVVDEIVRPFVEENWKSATEAPNMIDGAIELCRRVSSERTDMALSYGCPFNNLINEMSSVDEGFRKRLNQILQDWRQGISEAIARAQALGQVRADADPLAVSAFIISCIEGCVGMGKASQSREFLEAGFRGLIDYLEHLRPEPHES
jgi:TetR/AcrR family transcriptional regulator, transcriptional repressor for nem operon